MLSGEYVKIVNGSTNNGGTNNGEVSATGTMRVNPVPAPALTFKLVAPTTSTLPVIGFTVPVSVPLDTSDLLQTSK